MCVTLMQEAQPQQQRKVMRTRNQCTHVRSRAAWPRVTPFRCRLVQSTGPPGHRCLFGQIIFCAFAPHRKGARSLEHCAAERRSRARWWREELFRQCVVDYLSLVSEFSISFLVSRRGRCEKTRIDFYRSSTAATLVQLQQYLRNAVGCHLPVSRYEVRGPSLSKLACIGGMRCGFALSWVLFACLSSSAGILYDLRAPCLLTHQCASF